LEKIKKVLNATYYSLFVLTVGLVIVTGMDIFPVSDDNVSLEEVHPIPYEKLKEIDDLIIFNDIELKNKDSFYNETSKVYLDTLVSVAIEEMEINMEGITLQVLPLSLAAKIAYLSTGSRLYGRIEKSGYNHYCIYIDEYLNKFQSNETVVHELSHLIQMKTGALIVSEYTPTVIWNGKIYDSISQITYKERPWEIEAKLDALYFSRFTMAKLLSSYGEKENVPSETPRGNNNIHMENK